MHSSTITMEQLRKPQPRSFIQRCEVCYQTFCCYQPQQSYAYACIDKQLVNKSVSILKHDRIQCGVCHKLAHRYCYMPDAQPYNFVCDLCRYGQQEFAQSIIQDNRETKKKDIMKQHVQCCICLQKDGLLKRINTLEGKTSINKSQLKEQQQEKQYKFGHVLCLLFSPRFLVQSYQKLSFIQVINEVEAENNDKNPNKNITQSISDRGGQRVVCCSRCSKQFNSIENSWKCSFHQCQSRIHWKCLFQNPYQTDISPITDNLQQSHQNTNMISHIHKCSQQQQCKNSQDTRMWHHNIDRIIHHKSLINNRKIKAHGARLNTVGYYRLMQTYIKQYFGIQVPQKQPMNRNKHGIMSKFIQRQSAILTDLYAYPKTSVLLANCQLLCNQHKQQVSAQEQLYNKRECNFFSCLQCSWLTSMLCEIAIMGQLVSIGNHDDAKNRNCSGNAKGINLYLQIYIQVYYERIGYKYNKSKEHDFILNNLIVPPSLSYYSNFVYDYLSRQPAYLMCVEYLRQFVQSCLCQQSQLQSQTQSQTEAQVQVMEDNIEARNLNPTSQQRKEKQQIEGTNQKMNKMKAQKIIRNIKVTKVLLAQYTTTNDNLNTFVKLKEQLSSIEKYFQFSDGGDDSNMDKAEYVEKLVKEFDRKFVMEDFTVLIKQTERQGNYDQYLMCEDDHVYTIQNNAENVYSNVYNHRRVGNIDKDVIQIDQNKYEQGELSEQKQQIQVEVLLQLQQTQNSLLSKVINPQPSQQPKISASNITNNSNSDNNSDKNNNNQDKVHQNNNINKNKITKNNHRNNSVIGYNPIIYIQPMRTRKHRKQPNNKPVLVQSQSRDKIKSLYQIRSRQTPTKTQVQTLGSGDANSNTNSNSSSVQMISREEPVVKTKQIRKRKSKNDSNSDNRTNKTTTNVNVRQTRNKANKNNSSQNTKTTNKGTKRNRAKQKQRQIKRILHQETKNEHIMNQTHQQKEPRKTESNLISHSNNAEVGTSMNAYLSQDKKAEQIYEQSALAQNISHSKQLLKKIIQSNNIGVAQIQQMVDQVVNNDNKSEPECRTQKQMQKQLQKEFEDQKEKQTNKEGTQTVQNKQQRNAFSKIQIEEANDKRVQNNNEKRESKDKNSQLQVNQIMQENCTKEVPSDCCLPLNEDLEQGQLQDWQCRQTQPRCCCQRNNAGSCRCRDVDDEHTINIDEHNEGTQHQVQEQIDNGGDGGEQQVDSLVRISYKNTNMKSRMRIPIEYNSTYNKSFIKKNKNNIKSKSNHEQHIKDNSYQSALQLSQQGQVSHEFSDDSSDETGIYNQVVEVKQARHNSSEDETQAKLITYRQMVKILKYDLLYLSHSISNKIRCKLVESIRQMASQLLKHQGNGYYGYTSTKREQEVQDIVHVQQSICALIEELNSNNMHKHKLLKLRQKNKGNNGIGNNKNGNSVDQSHDNMNSNNDNNMGVDDASKISVNTNQLASINKDKENKQIQYISQLKDTKLSKYNIGIFFKFFTNCTHPQTQFINRWPVLLESLEEIGQRLILSNIKHRIKNIEQLRVYQCIVYNYYYPLYQQHRQQTQLQPYQAQQYQNQLCSKLCHYDKLRFNVNINMGTKTNVDVDEDADIRVDNVGIYKNTYEKKARTMKKYRQESSTNSITQKCITSKDDMSWLYQQLIKKQKIQDLINNFKGNGSYGIFINTTNMNQSRQEMQQHRSAVHNNLGQVLCYCKQSNMQYYIPVIQQYIDWHTIQSQIQNTPLSNPYPSYPHSYSRISNEQCKQIEMDNQKSKIDGCMLQQLVNKMNLHKYPSNKLRSRLQCHFRKYEQITRKPIQFLNQLDHNIRSSQSSINKQRYDTDCNGKTIKDGQYPSLGNRFGAELQQPQAKHTINMNRQGLPIQSSEIQYPNYIGPDQLLANRSGSNRASVQQVLDWMQVMNNSEYNCEPMIAQLLEILCTYQILHRQYKQLCIQRQRLIQKQGAVDTGICTKINKQLGRVMQKLNIMPIYLEQQQKHKWNPAQQK